MYVLIVQSDNQDTEAIKMPNGYHHLNSATPHGWPVRAGLT